MRGSSLTPTDPLTPAPSPPEYRGRGEKYLLAALLVAFGALCFAAAPPPKPARADDQLDYLFLGSDRPVLMRFHVRMGDKPYDAPWVEFMDRLFSWFDKDDDGFLSPVEVARLPSANSLLNHTLGAISRDYSGIAFSALDTNKDGKVSKVEFRTYFRGNGFPGFQFGMNNYQATTAKEINEKIFKRLDKAGEGYLTAEKVSGLYDKLRSFDENEDEMLDQSEFSTRGNGMFFEPVSGVDLLPNRPATIEPALSNIDLSQLPALVKQMMTKYDRNKDGKLTQAEVGLDPALFAKLDANKDGALDADELRAYFTTPPDLVLRLQIGTPSARKGAFDLFPGPRLAIVNEATMAAPLKKRFRRAGSDSIALELGDTRMAIQASAEQGQSRRYENVRNYYTGQFDRLIGKKAYIERSDLKDQPQLLVVFTQADRNADEKLTRVELFSWLNVVGSGLNANVTITANDLGRGLFPVLDADNDGRLSLREMKSAWTRLNVFAKDGKVKQADLPRTLRIVVGQGNINNFRPVVTTVYNGTTSRPMSRSAAPEWFRKMDKNNDGDISPREWLGTDEDFAGIDTDGDGLISVAEAIAFEKKKSKKD